MSGLKWGVLLSLSLLIAGVDSSADILPPPENFTVSQNPKNVSVTAQWSKPTGLDADCKVNYTVKFNSENCNRSIKCFYEKQTVHLNSTWDVSNQREIHVAVMTNPMDCGHKKPSKTVDKIIFPPLALVKNFNCVYYSHMKMNCTWSVISNTSDLQLFYTNENNALKPCISYLTSGHMKTGCHINDTNLITRYKFLISENVDGSKIPNTFIKEPHNSVKAEAPKLKITKKGEQLYLESSTPNFSPYCWKYKFTYNACKKKIEREDIVDNSSLRLEYDAACKYTAQAQVIFTNFCGVERMSEMSEPYYYGVDSNLRNPFEVAIILIPILMSCCLIVALVLFKRYKDIILPKIPEPSLSLFKDILNSNNKGGNTVKNQLYVPIPEDVERDVSLEPESTSLHPKP